MSAGAARTTDAPEVAALVLAAGRGSRFGGRKVLAPLRGAPLLAHAVAAARGAGLPVHVVVPSDPAVRAAALAAGATAVVDLEAEGGQRASLQAGLAGLPPATTAAVVLLGDQPGIAPEVVRTLVRTWRAAPASPHRVRYDDGPGHPVLLPATTWPAVLAADAADVGARDLLATLGVAEVVVAGPAPRDVDRPEDLGSA